MALVKMVSRLMVTLIIMVMVSTEDKALQLLPVMATIDFKLGRVRSFPTIMGTLENLCTPTSSIVLRTFQVLSVNDR